MLQVLKKLVFVVMFLGASSSVAFASIVYTASRPVGSGSVNLSLTTDGTLGVLGTSNIIDWTISMVDGPDSFTLLGPLSGANSARLVAGSALTATATELQFNYDAGGSNFLLIQSPGIGSSQFFWSVQTNGSFDFAGPAEAILPRSTFTFVKTPYRGNLVIASAASVPEPSSLTLLGLGAFGMVAGAIRRRRQTKAIV